MLHSPHRAARWGVALLVALTGVMATPSASAVDAAWQVQTRLSFGGSAGAVSCPTAAVCWAVSGGALLYSNTGGAAWTDASDRVPSSVESLDDIECPAVDTCYLGGQQSDRQTAVVALTPTGDRAAAVSTLDLISSLSCPTTTRCLATDRTHIFATTDAGATWTQTATLAYAAAQAVGCAPGTRRCWAVGGGEDSHVAIARSVDGGLTWRSQVVPDVQGAYLDVDCQTAVDCVVVGSGPSATGAVVVTHDGGTTWTPPHLPTRAAPYPLYSVSCASLTVCTASGGPAAFGLGEPYAIRTGNGGSGWYRLDYGQRPYGNWTGARDLACPAAARCVAVPNGVYTLLTTNGGTSWTEAPIPAQLDEVRAMSCPTATSCVALAADAVYRAVAMRSADAGRTWSRTVLPTVLGYTAAGLECPTVSACVALYVDSHFDGVHTRTTATVFTTADGGATWRQRDSANSPRLRKLSCPTATTCLALGAEPTSMRPAVYATTDGGRTWPQRTLPTTVPEPASLDCGSASSCVLIGGDGTGANTQAAVTTDLGTTYTAGVLPPDGSYGPVSCVGVSCHAIGGHPADNTAAIAASNDGGVTWTPQTPPPATDRLWSISCSSATVCVIGADGGRPNHRNQQIVGTTDGGATWVLRTLPPAGFGLPRVVACLSPTAALAADISPVGAVRILAGRP